MFFMVGIFFSCKNSIKEIDEVNDDTELPLQTIYNGTFNYSERGALLQRITAAEMNQYKNEDLLASGGLQVEMFSASGGINALLKSKNGIYRKEENILIATDSVRLSNKDGDVLITEKITLYQDSNLIFTDKPIEIHKGDNIIFGEGLTADAGFSNYRIINPAGTRIVIPEDSLDTK